MSVFCAASQVADDSEPSSLRNRKPCCSIVLDTAFSGIAACAQSSAWPVHVQSIATVPVPPSVHIICHFTTPLELLFTRIVPFAPVVGSLAPHKPAYKISTPKSPEASVMFTLLPVVPASSSSTLASVPVELVWSTPVNDTEPPASSAYADGILETDTVFAPEAGFASPQRTALFLVAVSCPPNFVMDTPLYVTVTFVSELVFSPPPRPTTRYRFEPLVV